MRTEGEAGANEASCPSNVRSFHSVRPEFRFRSNDCDGSSGLNFSRMKNVLVRLSLVLSLPLLGMAQTPPPAPIRSVEVNPDRTITFRYRDALAAKVTDRKSTRLNSSHLGISYAVFCLKKK